jgi:glycosyltransferase involved in cell wall biosynthesis
MPFSSLSSEQTNRGYKLTEIRVGETIASVRVPQNRSGLAFMVRHASFPLGFFMQALPPGSTLNGDEIASRIVRDFGPGILRDLIECQLVSAAATVPLDFPSLDIVVCTRDRTEQLSRCLNSFRQMLGDADDSLPGRILVIDNSPANDETERIVRTFPKVSYYREVVPGLDFARNRALAESSAEFIAFVDDDAIVDRSWLAGLKHAWQMHPDAAGFTGPVFPLELETGAQVLFEEMGGFGSDFTMMRFGPTIPGSKRYPYNAGMVGTGCNMVFRRQLLLDLGGFDEALDTGEPLPGGGDIDMFYRLIRSGQVVVREPKMAVYHQHRRGRAQLRHQMWTWGLSIMAFMSKCYLREPTNRSTIREWIGWWFRYTLRKMTIVYRGQPDRRPADLVLAEIVGAIVGLCGEYQRSRRRVARRRTSCTRQDQQRSSH